MTFGEKIKMIRKKKGISQQFLGEKLGVKQQTVAQYEKIQDTPKLETVRKIATALDVPVGILIDDWSAFSPDEINQDLSHTGEVFIEIDTKKAPEEMCKSFLKRMTAYASELSRHMNSLNDAGQQEAVRQVELLTKIPEYRKEDKPE